MRGYDKHILDHQLLLDLSMREVVGGDGDYIFDRARPHHTCLLHGATIGWVQLPSGLYVMDFTPGTPDWIDCPQADTVDLDFTTGDFSACAWIYTSSGGNRYILCRGRADNDGWGWWLAAGGGPTYPLYVTTDQGGAHQYTISAEDIAIDTWTLVSFSRSGDSIRTFKNGIDNTTTVGTHVNPLTATRELHIGIYDTEGAGYWDGRIWRPRIWGRYVEEWEWLELFNMERHWLGV